MTLDESLSAFLEAHFAPLHQRLDRMEAEIVELRRSQPPQLVSVRDAAKALGVSLPTARRRVKAGEWPVRRDGRRVLVDLRMLHPITDEEVARLARQAREAANDPERRRHGLPAVEKAVG